MKLKALLPSPQCTFIQLGENTVHVHTASLTSCLIAIGMTSSIGMAVDQSKETSAEPSLYPWEDWVVVYLRHMRQLFDKEVPTNER